MAGTDFTRPDLPAARLQVVIPALNAAAGLPATLAALAEGRAAGLVAAVTVVDGGSTDGTIAAALAGGAVVTSAPRGRGTQLGAGAVAASAGMDAADWFLFLHADTILAPGWADAVRAHIAGAHAASGQGRGIGPGGALPAAAFFRFALDDDRPEAKRLERMVGWRCRVLRLPYGDQGLLIARPLYDALGGYRPLPLMEDVDIIRRLIGGFGRAALASLPVPAVTSAVRFRRDGYLLRSARNLALVALWFLGVPAHLIRRMY